MSTTGRGTLFAPIVTTVMLLVFLSIWIGTTSNIPMEGVRIPFMLFGTLVVVLGIYSVFKHYLVIRNAVQGMEQQQEKESEPVSGTYTGYCPYCGSPVNEEYAHCRVCGKKL